MKAFILLSAGLALYGQASCFGQTAVQRRVPMSMVWIEQTSVENPVAAPETDECLPYTGPCPADPVSPFLRLPGRDIADIIHGFGGIERPDGQFSLRGSRNAPLVFIDGVKTRGSYRVPVASLYLVHTYWGAVPADIGDTDSGAILIETRSAFLR